MPALYNRAPAADCLAVRGRLFYFSKDLPVTVSKRLRPTTLGIDFGTSNSAMAYGSADGHARMLTLEGQASAMPTAVFFNVEERRTQFGRDAVAEYLQGTEGRLLRSLKSILGTALMDESTAIGDGSMRFVEIVAVYLRELADRMAEQGIPRPERVVLGRPVHFDDDNIERDARAQQSLADAAQLAGLGPVQFQLEPIAAALAHERSMERETIILVADIGGGTSDFSVVRVGPERQGRADRSDDILATRGVHIGGTDFDQRLSLSLVMPLLGLGHRGPQGREVPSAVFHDLATWHLIQWRYLPAAVREAKALRTNYSDTALHDRLVTVLTEQHGHRMAHAVEQAKIAVSSHQAPSTLDLGDIERALSATLDPAQLQERVAAQCERITSHALACIDDAGLAPSDIGALCLTGGSSALHPLRTALHAALPHAPLREGDLFGGVAMGLALGG